MTEEKSIPTLLAGPILRHVDTTRVTLWLVTSKALNINLQITQAQSTIEGETIQRSVPVGKKAFIHIVTFKTKNKLDANTCYDYDLLHNEQSLIAEIDHLHYSEHSTHFVFQPVLTHVAHGSCRKPHHKSDDALLQLDKELETELSKQSLSRPDIMLMSGDQVYMDDVAGPMVQAINTVVETLGLFTETLSNATIESSAQLRNNPDLLYKRESLLPKVPNNDTLIDAFFGAKEKPVFTSVNANNHLISLSEMIAMYLLVWSPTCWEWVSFDNHLNDQTLRDQFDEEKTTLTSFVNGLDHVQRVLAHVPTYMIFDDHDVTDDWNLTRGWEEVVYGHALSKRVIGNALTAYWLCQGWANDVDAFDALFEQSQSVFKDGLPKQDDFIQCLFDWPNWSYKLNTSPLVYVLDSRTRRWRSESNKHKPSGLLDWEALCEFQQAMIGHERVIVVSPAPIFGVKFIEAIQRVFTFFGKALVVDAENWMAHKGTANVMLNIFKHRDTPPQFIILSGDVHYNFVYDVSIKHSRYSPNIVQVTSSGIKNTFPGTLLRILDKMNQMLYASRSPLNWFTKRRTMKIKARRPACQPLSTLINTPSLGKVRIQSDNDEVNCEIVTPSGKIIYFEKD